MKHIFIVNPAAGSGKAKETIETALSSINGIDYQIYLTEGAGDSTRYIKEYCTKNTEEQVRFYACGGDGTLNEAVNGVVDFPNAELGCYPCGSGNDFVKYYGGKERFLDIKSLVEAPSTPIDLIKVGDMYSINVVNFGFDTCVARTMINVKSKPIIGGKNAYNTGVFHAVLTAMKSKGRIYADGELLNEKNERFLLCTAANGQYIGGQFRCAPRSVNDDGYMEVCMVDPISRFTFIKLIGCYTEGKHLDDERFKKIIHYRRCKTLAVEAPEGFAISVDGEIVETNKFTCEIVKHAIKFAVPGLSATEETKANETETV